MFCISDIAQCNSTTFLVINETRYPGEVLSVSVVLTGYNFGRVAGSVYTNAVGRDYREVISESQHVQIASMQCTKLQYNIISRQNQTRFVLLVLTAQDRFTPKMNDFETSLNNANSDRCKNLHLPPCTALLTTPVYVNVTIEECPLGFILNETIGICDCDQTISTFTHDNGSPLTCTIQNRTGYITRKGTIWVGVDTKSNTDIYYWHRNCPRDHCNRSQILVDLRHPDVQCRLNRDGVLCGSCQSGYSLQLGSNECAQCDNNMISLLIFLLFLAFYW